jgi:nucleotide-binding universal stress UspA family protein
MPYKHVLVVYDGTDVSKEVLQIACRFARPDRARMTILVLRLLPLSESIPSLEGGADPQATAIAAEAEQLARRCGIHAATSVRYARALGPAVVSEARLHTADLLALAIPDLDQLKSERVWHADVRTILRQTSCALMLLRPGRT